MDIVATGAYCEILMRMMMRQYASNGNGSVQFLKDMKHDRFGANVLADDGDISDGQHDFKNAPTCLQASQPQYLIHNLTSYLLIKRWRDMIGGLANSLLQGL